MATQTTTRRAPAQRAPTFRRLSEVGEWTKQAQTAQRAGSLHIDLTTTMLQRTMEQAASRGMMDRAVARFKARRALRQYRRAAAHVDAAADCLGKGWNDIQQQFEELIHPQKAKQSFDWQH